MSNSFRQSMAWLHTWAGVALGWVLYFIFVTGTVGYFAIEIDQWMTPERPLSPTTPETERAVATATAYLQERAPDASRWSISPPGPRENPDLQVSWSRPGAGRHSEVLEPGTGQAAEHRDTGGGATLYRMHYQLHYLPRTTAFWIVGFCAMAMLIILIAGIVIHRRIFSDMFTFRTGKGQRSWLDAHNLFSVLPLPFHLMITYSGLVFLGFTYMAVVISAGYGSGPEARQTFFNERFDGVRHVEPAGAQAELTALAPLVAQAESRWGEGAVRRITVQNPGDANARVAISRDPRTVFRAREQLIFDGTTGTRLANHQPPTTAASSLRESLLGLHEGRFAGVSLRWLYVLSGLAGAAMIGTGLILWTAKRRQKREISGAATAGLALVERCNVAAIVGLPVAMVAYFLANRLLPVGMDARADWEVHIMFLTWAALLGHALVRPVHRLWQEQLGLATAACLLLPVVNLATTDRHLGAALPAGNWVMAGVDLAALAGAALAVFALRRLSLAPGLGHGATTKGRAVATRREATP